MEKPIKRVTNTLNQTNGGESLILVTEFYKEKCGHIYVQQSIELMSYCNSATINIGNGDLTPELLRKIADNLEAAKKEIS